MIDEVVKLRVKPNAFLYALEASRLYLVLMFAVALVMMPVAHLKTGLPIGGLMLATVFTTYGALSSIFFVAVIFAAHCMEFIVTNKRVIVRASLMGRTQDNISIPIESIKVSRFVLTTRAMEMFILCAMECRLLMTYNFVTVCRPQSLVSHVLPDLI